MKKCLGCGGEFEPVMGMVNHQKFCSTRCRRKHFNDVLRPTARYRKMVTCAVCGNEFETRKHKAAATCSMACRIALWQQTQAERKSLFPGKRQYIKNGRWSKQWDCCRRCGGTESKHGSNGLCMRCVSVERYRRAHGIPLDAPKWTFAPRKNFPETDYRHGLVTKEFLDYMMGVIK